MSFQIFSGIYESFADTKSSAETVFASNLWISKTRDNVRKAYEDASFCEDYSLGIITAVSQRDGKVRIIDFGGGLGRLFPTVAASLPSDVDLDFHVVDNANSCRFGRECHGNDQRIHFHDSLPDTLDNVDLIHLGSVLQYIDDCWGLLSRLAKYKAKHILFSDTMVGEVPTFITTQDYYGAKTPFRFININELITFFDEKLGYRLLYKAKYIQTVQGKRGFFDMSNLPKEYRLDSSYNLLFGK